MSLRMRWLLAIMASLLGTASMHAADSIKYVPTPEFTGYLYYSGSNRYLYNGSATTGTHTVYPNGYSSRRYGVVAWDMSGLSNIGKVESVYLKGYQYRYSPGEVLIVPIYDTPTQNMNPVNLNIPPNSTYTSISWTGPFDAQCQAAWGSPGWMYAEGIAGSNGNFQNYNLNGTASGNSTRTGGTPAGDWVIRCVNETGGRGVMALMNGYTANTTSGYYYFYGPGQTSANYAINMEITYIPAVEILTTSAPDARVDFPYSLTPSAQYGVSPYLWSFDKLDNADWLSMPDPRTGQLVGEPPIGLVNKSVQVRVTVTDDNGAGEARSSILNFKVKGVPTLPYNEGYESGSFEPYTLELGPRADAKMTGATQGPDGSAARTGANGLVLAGANTSGWNNVITVADPAHQAILDDPTKWWPNAANPDISAFHGRMSWFARAPQVTNVQVQFDWRIVNQSSAGNNEYYAQAVLEWSEDQGQTWMNMGGAGATAGMGLYRSSTTTQWATETITLNPSGNQTYLSFRVRWIANLPGNMNSLNTAFDLDNFVIRAPVDVLTTSLAPGQELVPYERPGFTQPLDAAGGNGTFTFKFGTGGTTTSLLHSNDTVISFPGTGLALETYTDANGMNFLRIPQFVGPTQYKGAPLAPAVGQYNLELIAEDSNGEWTAAMLDFTVLEPPPPLSLVNAPQLPAAAEGREWEFALSAYGGVPPYTFTMLGATATWVNFDPASGTLFGTPPNGSSGQTVSVDIEVVDFAGNTATTIPGVTNPNALPFSFQIVNALTVAVSSLPPARESDTYQAKLFAAGGTPPYTWSVLNGMPAGMKFSPQTGQVFGSPAVGTSSPNPIVLQLQVSDAAGLFHTQNVTMRIDPATSSFMTITTTNNFPAMLEGDQVDFWFNATGGRPPYVWSASPGSLPVGLSLSEDGNLKGTIASGTARNYTMSIRLTDSRPVSTPITNYNLTVNEVLQPLAITTVSQLPTGEVGKYYVHRLEAVEGTPPYTWSLITETLPAPLSLDGNVGLIVGLPRLGDEGSYAFTARVTDAAGAFVDRTFNLNLEPSALDDPLRFVTTALPNARVGDQYGMTVFAAGGNKPYQFRILDGVRRPNGLNFSPFGTLSGTPQVGADGNYPMTFEIEDSAGRIIRRTMDLKVLTAVQTDEEATVDVGNGAPVATVEESGAGGCSLNKSSSKGWLILVALSAGGVVALRRRRQLQR